MKPRPMRQQMMMATAARQSSPTGQMASFLRRGGNPHPGPGFPEPLGDEDDPSVPSLLMSWFGAQAIWNRFGDTGKVKIFTHYPSWESVPTPQGTVIVAVDDPFVFVVGSGCPDGYQSVFGPIEDSSGGYGIKRRIRLCKKDSVAPGLGQFGQVTVPLQPSQGFARQVLPTRQDMRIANQSLEDPPIRQSSREQRSNCYWDPHMGKFTCFGAGGAMTHTTFGSVPKVPLGRARGFARNPVSSGCVIDPFTGDVVCPDEPVIIPETVDPFRRARPRAVTSVRARRTRLRRPF